MATAKAFFDKLAKIDILFSAQVAIENTASAATKAQRNQLWQGVMSDDGVMPDYSFRSVFQYNKPPGPIKLFDQGDFYKGIFIDVRQDIFIIESADEKNTMLQNRYGKEILGLGTDAKIEYIRTLKPAYIKEIKSYLN